MDPGVRDGRVYAALLHGQDTGHGVGAAGRKPCPCLGYVWQGQPSGVTINSQLFGPGPVRWNFGPKQPRCYGVPLPGSCDLTVYK